MNHSPNAADRRRQLNDWLAAGDGPRWRKAAEHTRRDACRRVHVHESTLFRWETGAAEPDAGNWRRAYRYYKSIKPKEESPCPPPRSQSSGEPAPAGSPDVQSESST